MKSLKREDFSSPRAESARAVTGRRNSYRWEGGRLFDHITFVVTFVSCQKFPFVLAGPIVFIMTRRQRQMIKLYNVIRGNLEFVHIPFQTLINQFQKQLL